MPIANSDHPNTKILIEAGAYDLAIEQLQQATAEDPDPNDLYNLGLCFEAIGDYGLAHTTYREAWEADSENLLFAQGLGRIERLGRENPKFKRRQLESRDRNFSRIVKIFPFHKNLKKIIIQKVPDLFNAYKNFSLYFVQYDGGFMCNQSQLQNSATSPAAGAKYKVYRNW
ncbi:MAG: hypothetical protein Ct9H300mP28_35620 [Pseudomonadota bacterium]|nr:MAG: hypothetical protein Ct9H300mP28_35620 [Pseudomonadota bacterium]